MPRLTQSALAPLIDHTLLKPEATAIEIDQLCREALQFQFATVCVQPSRVPLAYQLLKDSTVKVCTVIGFPLGANATAVKAFETERAVADGAREIDMVINLGALREKDDHFVENDIRAVVNAAGGLPVKVILETCLLNEEEIVRACQLSARAGAAFVKTSTGFSKGGATVEAVALMRKTVGQKIGVKASGGIRDLATLESMVSAGANRIGTSSGASLMQNREGKGPY